MTDIFNPIPSKQYTGWFEIPGFSGYCANPKGEILTKKTGRISKGSMSGRYLRVAAYRDGAKRHTLEYLHIIMCLAFKGPPPFDGAVVLHLDNDRTNVKPDNLKWGTQSENIQQVWDDGLRVRFNEYPGILDFVKQFRINIGNESLVTITKKLYHGSDKLFKTIKPLGVNMGTRFSKPKLSSFFWESESEALGWLVFQVFRRVVGVKCFYHIPSGGFIIRPENENLVRSKVDKVFGYLYTAKLNLVDVGVGSSPDIKEFTVDKEVIPDSTKKVKVTSSLLDKYLLVWDDVQIKEYIDEIDSGKFSKRRGIVLSILLDRERDLKRHDPKLKDDLGLESLPASSTW